MDVLFDLSFYLMGAMLALPFIVLAGFVIRVLKVHWGEALLLLPAAMIGIMIADLWFIGNQGCHPFYRGFCEGLAIIGWIFYLPVLFVLTALNCSAMSLIIPRTWQHWRK